MSWEKDTSWHATRRHLWVVAKACREVPFLGLLLLYSFAMGGFETWRKKGT